MPSTAKTAPPFAPRFIEAQTLVSAERKKARQISDCYETKGDKQMKAMFRFSEHRFLSLVKA
jgi:hypothetical protein